MTKDKIYYPVTIIGGGPAGLATSLTLSARGIPHALVEAQAKAVAKPGEAIPPNARPLLRQLGIENLLTAAVHHPYYGNKSCWGSEKLYQEEFMKGLHGHGYLLHRQYFEEQLRATVAARQGVLHSAYRCQQLTRATDGFTILINNGTKKQQLFSNYIVDATGRKASVCRHLGITKQHLDQQFAITMQVQLSTKVERQIYIAATEKGWWYAAPMGSQSLSLMFFTLRDLLPPKTEQAKFLEAQKDNSPLFTKLLTGLDWSQIKTKLMPAGTSRLPQAYGDRWLAVGDAAFAYDPISSYGITSALAGAYYGAHALANTLRGDQDALPVYQYLMERAFQAYGQKLKMHYAQETRWKTALYWRQRLAFTAKKAAIEL